MRYLIAVVLVVACLGGVGEVAAAENASEVRIIELLPNPATDYDRGEYIMVEIPHHQQLGNWTFVDDGVQRARPPPVTANTTVAFSHHPNVTRQFVDVPVIELEGWLQLADAGEEVTLYINGSKIDRVAYDGPAPRNQRWVRASTGYSWEPLGGTDFDPVTATGDVNAFALPDSPERVLEVIESAESRLYIGGYTLTQDGVVDRLIEAETAGVAVRVHVDGRPVGGVSTQMGEALDRLISADIPTTVHWGEFTRWGFHHAKYAVADDTVLVMTENWKPAGTGGRSSRGWAVVVENASLADAVVDVFRADTTWHDAICWSEARTHIDRHEDPPATGEFPRQHHPTDAEDVSATLLVTPDNAEKELSSILRGAKERILIKQVRITDPQFPLLAATLEAARDGVAVSILLSNAWYVRDENAALAEELENIADRDDLDLAVELAEDQGTFRHIHAKGIVIDDETVVVGSINWNNHSLRQNRELAVVLTDPTIASFYADVFWADWPAFDGWVVPLELVGVTLAAGGLVYVHYRRMSVAGKAAQAEETLTE